MFCGKIICGVSTLHPRPDPVGMRKHVAHRGDEGHRSLATLCVDTESSLLISQFPTVGPLKFRNRPVHAVDSPRPDTGLAVCFLATVAVLSTLDRHFEPWPANLINGGADADDLSLLNSRWRPSATGDAGVTAGVVRRWAEG